MKQEVNAIATTWIQNCPGDGFFREWKINSIKYWQDQELWWNEGLTEHLEANEGWEPELLCATCQSSLFLSSVLMGKC